MYMASAADIQPVAAALAKAFHDDPLTSWMFPDEASRPKRLTGLFSLLMRKQHLVHGEVWTLDGHPGAALWDPPDKWKLPVRDQILSLPSFLRVLGGRTVVAMQSLAQVEKVHPREPHWYLAVLGTEPAMQGKGIGSSLMQPVLERCDSEGLPAYLESSKEKNIPFYSRHGFEVTGEIKVGRGGPTIWPMWRNPR